VKFARLARSMCPVSGHTSNLEQNPGTAFEAFHWGSSTRELSHFLVLVFELSLKRRANSPWT
jgi:hypothetical protein